MKKKKKKKKIKCTQILGHVISKTPYVSNIFLGSQSENRRAGVRDRDYVRRDKDGKLSEPHPQLPGALDNMWLSVSGMVDHCWT